MDPNTDHLVTPVKLRDRGLPLWVGIGLGCAGIIVSLGGVYEISQRRAAAEATRPAPRPAITAEQAEVARLQRELRTERARRAAAEHAAEQPAPRRQPIATPGDELRCIDRTLFRKKGNSWENVGRC